MLQKHRHTVVCGSEPVVPLGFYWTSAAAECAPPASPSSPKPVSALPLVGDADLLIWCLPPPRSAAGPERPFAPAVAASAARQLLPHIQVIVLHITQDYCLTTEHHNC